MDATGGRAGWVSELAFEDVAVKRLGLLTIDSDRPAGGPRGRRSVAHPWRQPGNENFPLT